MLKEELKEIKWFVVDDDNGGFKATDDELQGISLSYKDYGADFDIYFNTRNFSTRHAFKTKTEAVDFAKQKLKEKYERDLENILNSG